MAPLLLIGGALGGAAMYFFDPDRGRRRRALVRDQATKATRKTEELFEAATRDLANRASAVPHHLRSVWHHDSVSDGVLAERVRSKMGRYVSHPRAIHVKVEDSCVTLSGSILAREHAAALHAVRGVDGVREAIDRLAVHETARGISELQGGRERRGERMELFQDHWGPGARMLTGAAATALALYALRNGGVFGLAAFVFGAALFARAAANRPLGQVVHFDGAARARPTTAPDHAMERLDGLPAEGAPQQGTQGDVSAPM